MYEIKQYFFSTPDNKTMVINDYSEQAARRYASFFQIKVDKLLEVKSITDRDVEGRHSNGNQ